MNHSGWDHALERDHRGQWAIRLGMRLVSGFNAAAAERISNARTGTPFRSLQDVKERAGLSKLETEALIASDALAPLSGHRAQAHWESAALAPVAPLLSDLERSTSAHLTDDIQRPAPTECADMLDDYHSTGLSLRVHPMTLLREQRKFATCTRAADLSRLPHGRFVRIAGVVTGRQRPGTASGIVFMTLEDETGNANVVVKTDVQERYRKPLLGSHIAMVKGILELRQGVAHVLAGEIEDVSHALRDFAPGSRDFH